MNNKTYSRYDEKYLKSIMVYAEADKDSLYMDEECEIAVNKHLIANAFTKGLLVVNFDGVSYTPNSLSMNNKTFNEGLEHTVKVYNGTKMLEFYSDSDPKEIIPIAPTFSKTTGVVTIPDQTGVSYLIIGEDEFLDSGVQEPIEPNKVCNIVAIPSDGFQFVNESTNQWTFTWLVVVPEEPDFDEDTGIITIPEQMGINYKIGGDVLEPGEQDPISMETTVVAVAVGDYNIKSNSTYQWTFTKQ